MKKILIFLAVILILILVGVFLMITSRSPRREGISSSDNPLVIEKELNETDIGSLDQDLQELESSAASL